MHEEFTLSLDVRECEVTRILTECTNFSVQTLHCNTCIVQFETYFLYVRQKHQRMKRIGMVDPRKLPKSKESKESIRETLLTNLEDRIFMT